MSNEATKTPQEALSKATTLIENLRASLPGKVGAILTCMDEIKNAWENQDLEQFPFNLLHGEVNALASVIRSEYDDLNQDVDRKSSVYEQVLSLQYRLRMSIEFVVSSRIFESVERRFRRIEEMLPARNYSMRDLLSELAADHIGLAIKKRLEAAIHRFDRQEYKAVLRECGEAGEAMFALYKSSLSQDGCEAVARNKGASLEHIRGWLSKGSKDRQGHSFGRHCRIEWLLLTMFESLHYLRNAASHALEVEGDIPIWQRQRRELMTEKPEYARLALCVCLQIALELQALLDRQGSSG